MNFSLSQPAEQSSPKHEQKLPMTSVDSLLTSQLEKVPSNTNVSNASHNSNPSLANVAHPPLTKMASQASLAQSLPPNQVPNPYFIHPEKVSTYKNIFTQNQTVDGFMEGAAARNIFLQSGLPPEFLAQVWNLVDLEQTGRLSELEFLIAMHFLQLKISQGIEPPPTISLQEVQDYCTGQSSSVEQFDDPDDLVAVVKEIAELKKQKESLMSEVKAKESKLNSIKEDTQKVQEKIEEVDALLNTFTQEKGRVQNSIDQNATLLNDFEIQRKEAEQKAELSNQKRMKRQSKQLELMGKGTDIEDSSLKLTSLF